MKKIMFNDKYGLTESVLQGRKTMTRRLRDISDKDCMKEGIQRWKRGLDLYFFEEYGDYDTPREAFAALIDKVSGRGTWDRNPWVFAYSFELVK